MRLSTYRLWSGVLVVAAAVFANSAAYCWRRGVDAPWVMRIFCVELASLAILLLSGVVVFMGTLRWFRGFAWSAEIERKRRHGRCEACGYDLTGNVSGVCPECGTKIAEN